MAEHDGGAPAPWNLRRFLEPRPRARVGDVCELCGTCLSDRHSHLVNVKSRALLCACRPCYLLFTHRGAAGGHYRAVPERYVFANGLVLTERHWDGLQIPVGIAFFFFNSSIGRTVAFYPSPAGATESQLPLETWDELVKANPVLADLHPDVEALLVHKGPDTFECYLVPIDACYELVGLIRRSWKGFGGGEEAWREINGFFAGLRERCGETGDGGAGWPS
jgi:hypothetical protein